MQRRTLLVLVLFLLVPWAVAAEGVSAVEVTTERTLATFDLGLEELSVSPDGQNVIVIGTNGFALRFSTSDVSEEIELNSGDEDDLTDVDWHPRGETALLVGDGGTMLRYATSDHSVTHVAGSTAYFLGQSLSSVAWDAAGGWAYVGAPDGSITRYRENANGNGEFFTLNDTKSSKIADIACLKKMHSHCVFATQDDGMGIIDVNHEVAWLTGSEGTMWRAVICPHPARDRCYGAGQGSVVGVVELNPSVASDSYVLVKQVNIEAEFTGFHVRTDDAILIQTAPFGWIDWDVDDGTDGLGYAYPWIYNHDAGTSEPMIGSEGLIGGWKSTDETGYGVTSFGRIVQYAPPAKSVDEKIVSSLAGIVLIIAVPGSVLGLMFMMSPKMQKKYIDWSNSRITARNEKGRKAHDAKQRRKPHDAKQRRKAHDARKKSK
jgi:hypothetical protein